MIDLTQLAGLPLGLTPIGELAPLTELAAYDIGRRSFADLRPVLADPQALADATIAGSDDSIAYLMYRGVALPGDAVRLADQHLRYDVTVIRPGVIGGEYVKTAGHYHPAAPSGVAYGEVYAVLAGRAAYLLQRTDGRGISDTVVIHAGPGDKINIPPGYGHVTINTGETPLVMCNLVATDFVSSYGDFVDQHGGAYYFIKTDRGPTAIANPRYPRYPGVPALREAAPTRATALGLTVRPLYTVWQQEPTLFRYLVQPELLPAGLRP